MNRIAIFALFFVALGNSVMPTYASDNFGCNGANSTEAHSLAALPSEVAAALGQGRHGGEGIADHGGRFLATDVILAGEEGLPWRRFSSAAISSDCIWVAVEHGGRGYFVELWFFELSKDGWHGYERPRISKVPSSLHELIHAGH